MRCCVPLLCLAAQLSLGSYAPPAHAGQASSARGVARVDRAATPIPVADGLRALRENDGGRLSIEVDTGSRVALLLHRLDLLAPGAQVTVTTAQGTEPFRVEGELFIGSVEDAPGSRAVILVSGEDVSGRVSWAGRSYDIRPSPRAGPAHLLGVASEVLAADEATGAAGCATSLGDQARPNAALITDCGTTSWCPGPAPFDKTTRLVCRLAIECDYGLYTRCGSSVTNVVNYAQSLVGSTSALYQDSINVIFQVTSLHVWATTDPFVASTASQEHSNFAGWGGTGLAGVPRNAAVLLAGRASAWSDGFAGMAYINTLCDSASAYATCLAQGTTPPPNAGDQHTIAHELGHIFGGWHAFNCEWRTSCYLPDTYPFGTLLALKPGPEPRFEGGCCQIVMCAETCPFFDQCDINPNLCPITDDCTSLGFGADIMAYGGGLSMHPAVKARLREKAQSVLHAQPAGITDLSNSATCTTITLSWFSPASQAQAYDLRTSTQTITEDNFASATQLGTAPPLPSGSEESKTLAVGACSDKYYAIKWRDLTYAWSPISNVLRASTPCLQPPLQCDDGGGGAIASQTDHPELTLASASPARDHVGLAYAVPAGVQRYELTVLDVAGRPVRMLGRGRGIPGRFVEYWDLRNQSGDRVANGVYFIRLRVNDVSLSRTVVCVR